MTSVPIRVIGKNLFAKFREENAWEPFEKYTVHVRFVDLVGGCPKNPELIEGWINATNKATTAERRAEIVDATVAELAEFSSDVSDRQSIGFKLDGGGLYIEGRQIKAMLKESANVIKDIAPGGRDKKNAETKGITNLKSKIAEQVFVVEEKIYLGRATPDALEERPIHVMTAQGPRNSLKRIEVCRDVEVAFTLLRRRGNVVPEAAMLAILQYAQTMGGGSDRSQGRGRFEVLSVEKME